MYIGTFFGFLAAVISMAEMASMYSSYIIRTLLI
jgi:hypothetical protein